MKLGCKEIGSWGVLEIEGDIDSVHTKIFVDTFAEYVSKTEKGRNLILDLTKADFLSIGVIRYINQVSVNFEELGGRFVIMGANDRIRRHFDVFVGLKNLKEIKNIWEVIPLQMSGKFNDTKSTILAESLLEIDLPPIGINDQN